MNLTTIRRIWPVLRVIWVIAGLIFFFWMWRSFQAQGVDVAALSSSPTIYVATTGPSLEVMPIDTSEPVGLLFLPGGMVDPNAYLPMAHTLAEQGYPVIIAKLPYRSAPREEDEEELFAYMRDTIQDSIITKWAIGGHSRGAALAARFVRQNPLVADALILVATTHPKESAWSLVNTPVAVTKIYATNDGIAPTTAILANRHLLPPDATLIPIAGGNHSQFGYYGFQLGDQRATISRAEQQTQLVEIIVNTLHELN